MIKQVTKARGVVSGITCRVNIAVMVLGPFTVAFVDADKRFVAIVEPEMFHKENV